MTLPSSWLLSDRVALVTGASRGIGRAIALTLAERGASVAVNYARGDAAANEVVEAIRSAGISIHALLLRAKTEDLRRILAVNVEGAFSCARAAAKHLLKAKERGRIIAVSSVVGETGKAGQSMYAASKAALLGLTKSLAAELAGRAITVNAVTPGFIATDMTDAALQGAAREALLAKIPLRRIGEARRRMSPRPWHGWPRRPPRTSPATSCASTAVSPCSSLRARERLAFTRSTRGPSPHFTRLSSHTEGTQTNVRRHL